MPKITHSLNKVKVLKKHGYDKRSAKKALEEEVEVIARSYGKDQKEAVDILRLMAKKAVSAF